ncbi:hypothetical protein EGR_09823 [Echinococcus granulosus]|uniref:Uncharacterized protein n=1 Tax=Echinococcus granulosus TaxID=6210 RepID=W6U2M8_ECHGR|nr:hypothetical protein EGR_09823 [Echinococcus granulosus]EUB55328.1 hypothetical protein EGR_09823 [Echinococcus granulosus]
MMKPPNCMDVEEAADIVQTLLYHSTPLTRICNTSVDCLWKCRNKRLSTPPYCAFHITKQQSCGAAACSTFVNATMPSPCWRTLNSFMTSTMYARFIPSHQLKLQQWQNGSRSTLLPDSTKMTKSLTYFRIASPFICLKATTDVVVIVNDDKHMNWNATSVMAIVEQNKSVKGGSVTEVGLIPLQQPQQSMMKHSIPTLDVVLQGDSPTAPFLSWQVLLPKSNDTVFCLYSSKLNLLSLLKVAYIHLLPSPFPFHLHTSARSFHLKSFDASEQLHFAWPYPSPHVKWDLVFVLVEFTKQSNDEKLGDCMCISTQMKRRSRGKNFTLTTNFHFLKAALLTIDARSLPLLSHATSRAYYRLLSTENCEIIYTFAYLKISEEMK